MLLQWLRQQLELAVQTHLSRMASVQVAWGKIVMFSHGEGQVNSLRSNSFLRNPVCMKRVNELQPLQESANA